MIRLSTSQMFQNSLINMGQGQNRVNHTNNQLGTGKRMQTPADDPVAAAQTLNSKTRISVVQQYNRNVDFANKNLSLSETVLDQVESSLIRLKELAIQLGSDVYSSEQVSSAGSEARELQAHLKGLLNTRNESGEYIFSGSQGNRPAYDGNSFQGDRIEREVQVADSTFIRMMVSGDRAFENLEGLTQQGQAFSVPALPAFDATQPDAEHLGAYRSQGQLFGFRDQVEGARDASLESADAFAEWLVSSDAGAFSFPPGADLDTRKDWMDENWEQVRQDLPNPWRELDLTYDEANQAFTAFDPEFDANQVDLNAPGLRHNNMLSVVDFFVDSLGAGKGGEATMNREGIRASINNLDVAFEKVAQARAQIGSRQNTLDAAKTTNRDFELFAERTLSELEDLDYAEAISRFQQQTMSLQASQQAFSRVQNLSLFNHI